MIGRLWPCHVAKITAGTGRVRVFLITSPEMRGKVSVAFDIQALVSSARLLGVARSVTETARAIFLERLPTQSTPTVSFTDAHLRHPNNFLGCRPLGCRLDTAMARRNCPTKGLAQPAPHYSEHYRTCHANTAASLGRGHFSRAIRPDRHRQLNTKPPSARIGPARSGYSSPAAWQ